jgi:antitoxin component HigA of HigAB toxin-antitoxin module
MMARWVMRSDLTLSGGLNQVQEVLAGRRALSMATVRRLHVQPGIAQEGLTGT